MQGFDRRGHLRQLCCQSSQGVHQCLLVVQLDQDLQVDHKLEQKTDVIFPCRVQTHGGLFECIELRTQEE